MNYTAPKSSHIFVPYSKHLLSFFVFIFLFSGSNRLYGFYLISVLLHTFCKLTYMENIITDLYVVIIYISMWAIMIVSMTALFAGIFISAFLIPEGVWQLVTILVICIVFLIPCFYALKLEVSVGAYKCKNCGYEIVPTYSEALWAMHRGTTRHLKCPKCQKRTWCKKVLKK